MNNTIQLILGVIDCSVSLITLGWLHRPKLGFLLRWKYSEWLWIVNDPLVLIWSDWLLPNSTFPRFRVPWSRFLVDWEFFEARVHPLVVCPLISLLESGSMVDPLASNWQYHWINSPASWVGPTGGRHLLMTASAFIICARPSSQLTWRARTACCRLTLTYPLGGDKEPR